MEVHPSAIAIAVLGIGTWLLYVADRLLDASSPRHPALRERHFFHARHRTLLLQAAAVAGAVLLGLIGIMPASARLEDTVLFAVAMSYFAAVHLPVLRVRRWFPREIAVGIVFALATAVPAWSAADATHAQLTGLVVIFAGLCSLNCIAIEIWEHSAPSTRPITVPALSAGVAITAVTLALVSGSRSAIAVWICAASLASTMLLFALDRLHRSFTRRNVPPEDRARFLLILRVAADAALLTPLLLVLPWHP